MEHKYRVTLTDFRKNPDGRQLANIRITLQKRVMLNTTRRVPCGANFPYPEYVNQWLTRHEGAQTTMERVDGSLSSGKIDVIRVVNRMTRKGRLKMGGRIARGMISLPKLKKAAVAAVQRSPKKTNKKQ